MTETEKLLVQLRDIHEPLPPSGLPMSLWWITVLVAGSLLLIFSVMFWHRKQHRSNSVSAATLQLQLAQAESTDLARLRIARLLRAEAGLSPSVIQLTGEPWLQQLDKHFNTTWFTGGDGRQFGEALYQPSAEALSDEAFEKIQQLLEPPGNA